MSHVTQIQNHRIYMNLLCIEIESEFCTKQTINFCFTMHLKNVLHFYFPYSDKKNGFLLNLNNFHTIYCLNVLLT